MIYITGSGELYNPEEEISGESFGAVTVHPDTVTIEATPGQLWAWAHRPGALWPCSELARLEGPLLVTFDRNGLLDLTGDDDAELTGDELSAWATDCLRDVLPADHPAYAVAVGQFSEGGTS